jgi:hypothetical protein
LLHAVAPGWDEPIAIFLVGGLIGVFLYRFWIVTFASLVGSMLMAYCTLALLDRLHMVNNSVNWADKNGPLLNWACASLIVTGVLVQFLLERWRRRRSVRVVEKKETVPPAPPAPPPKPARSTFWTWSEKLLFRRAG